MSDHNVSNKALEYIQSIWPSSLSNLQRLTETRVCKDYYQTQHFISDSSWDAQEPMDNVSKEAGSNLTTNKLIGLHIDETGVRKKGKHSIGVDRQYCGNIGKIDNSQVAVYAALSQGDYATLIDSKLYLPKSWTCDKQRLAKAKVPLNHREFKSKQEITLEIINLQITLGTKFDYIGGDALYGTDQKLTDAIDAMPIPFLMDIRENQLVYLEQPQIQIPKPKSNRRRKPKNPKPDIEAIVVSEYLKTLTPTDFEQLKVRNTAKGKLTCLYHFKTVYIWDGERNRASQRLLMTRKTVNKKKVEVAYSLVNVSLAQYEPKAIANMQAQRFFIEHAFKEAKSVLGLNEFQTRKWIAWYHQVALNMLLLLFIFREKQINFESMPLLSAWDIAQIMQLLIISQMFDPDKVLV